jgi:capsular exopolysaccharide synthesis family protein
MDALSREYRPRPAEPGLIDVHAIGGIFRRRALTIAAVIGIAILLSMIAYFLASPYYYTSSRVALERQVEDIVPVQSDPGQRQVTTDSATVDTEVQVIKSPTIIGRVVDKLGLAHRPGFGFKAGDPPPTKDQIPAARARAIDVVSNGLNVNREGESYAIDIGFGWQDPQTPAEIVNTVTNAYLDSQREGLSAQTDEQVKLLGDRLQKLRGDVQSAEAAVARYRDQTNMVDIYNDNATAQQQIATINGQLAQARAQAAAAASRAASGNVPEVFNSPVISQLRAQEAQLASQEASMADRYGPLYPDRAQVHQQLDSVRSAIAQETARLRQGLVNEARAEGSQSGSLSSSVGGVIGMVRAGNNASVRLADLQRSADAARVLYSAMLERYRQAVATQGTEHGNAYIISPAPVPRAPSAPNLKVFLLAGVIAGMILAALVVLLLETLERGMRTRRELERALDIPAIASAPDLASVAGASRAGRTPLAASEYAIANGASMFGETFRSIRMSLRIGREDQIAKTIAVTSSIPNEGKTTIALGLARTTAKLGQRVVLVDCDERRRGSSNEFPPADYGLAEVLAGTARLEDALIRDTETSLSVLPQLTGVRPDYDMFASDRMQELMETLAQRFDLVIIDTAPVLPVAETRALAAMADRTLFVVRWQKTPIQTARMALDQLERSDAHVIGAVLSRIDCRVQAKYSDSEEMYFYREYDQHYADAA